MEEGRADRPRVSVIVVNWNQADLLKTCLRSLDHDHVRSISEVIVVDNGSTDTSAQMVRSEFPWVRLVGSAVNLGFTGGNELGLRHSRGEIVFLLNNDAEVEEHCLERLVAAFDRDPNVAIVGCLVKDARNRRLVLESGLSIDRFGFTVPTGFGRKDLPPFYVSGCALAIRRNVTEALGFFDDRFFMFMEDVDLCWRCRLAGLDVVVADDAVAYHQGGGSLQGGTPRGTVYVTSLRRFYFRERNTIAMLLKNYSLLSLVMILPVYLLVLVGEILVSLLMLRFRLATQFISAAAWNLRNLKGTLRLRRFVQSRRRIPDRALPFDHRFAKLLALRLVGMPQFVK